MMIETLNAWSGDVFALLVDMGLKGFGVLAIAGVASLALRQASASTRHLVWSLALIGLLFLPVLSLTMPALSLRVLPLKVAKAEEPEITQEKEPAIIAGNVEEKAPVLENAAEVYPVEPVMISQSTTEVDSVVIAESAVPPEDVEPILENRAVSVAVESQAAINTTPKTMVSLKAWLLSAWAAGAVLLVLPVIAGLVIVSRMRSRGRSISDRDMRSLADGLMLKMALHDDVRIVFGGRNVMPMAGGLGRCVVFLPDEAVEWPGQKLRAVLLHELAHVKRRDYLTHNLARLALALHWFNPLAWAALRQMRKERETACDDMVLRAGEAPEDYAESLVSVAVSMHVRGVASAAAVAMARRGRLKGRVHSILDMNRRRGNLSGWMTAGIVFAAIAILVPFAILELEKRIPYGVELSSDPNISLVRVKKSGTSSSGRSSENRKMTNYTLLNILKNMNGMEPFVMNVELPEGRYNLEIKEMSDVRIAKERLANVYSDAFGISVKRRLIEIPSEIVICPDPNNLELTFIEEEVEYSGTRNIIKTGPGNTMEGSYKGTISALVDLYGQCRIKTVPSSAKHQEYPLIDKVPAIDETGISDQVIETTVTWNTFDRSVMKKWMESSGFKIEARPYESVAFVVESAREGAKYDYLQDYSTPIRLAPEKHQVRLRIYDHENRGFVEPIYEDVFVDVQVERYQEEGQEPKERYTKFKIPMESMYKENRIVFVVPEEQKDAAVRSMMGNRNFIYDKPSYPTIEPSSKLEGKLLTIADADGNPIPEARVALGFYRHETEEIVYLKGFSTDANGMFNQNAGTFLYPTEYVVEHDDYGLAHVPSEYRRPEMILYVPLISKDSVHRDLALRGRITLEGTPVANASISVIDVFLGDPAIRHQGRGPRNVYIGRRHYVMTDEEGKFNYLPIQYNLKLGENPFPEDAHYSIRIEPAEGVAMPVWAGTVPANAPLALDHKKRTLHTIVFENENGPITDKDVLGYPTIRRKVAKGQKSAQIGYREFKDGISLIPGTYTAETQVSTYRRVKDQDFTYLRNGESFHVVFEPIEVTEDSPEVLTFHEPAARTFTGRVVNGITGEPMAGAFVIANTGSSNRFGNLTDEQWDRIEGLPRIPSLDDDRLEIITICTSYEKVMRTDEHGQFTMKRRNNTNYSFLVVARDYLPFSPPVMKLSDFPEEGVVEVPDLTLYPAARVRVGLKGKYAKRRVKPIPQINSAAAPDWAKVYNNKENKFSYKSLHNLDEPQWIHVPAEVPFRLTLDPDPSMFDNFKAYVFDEVLELKQGETLDLGVVELPEKETEENDKGVNHDD